MSPQNISSPLDSMARRCGYCGKFCSQNRIDSDNGLCYDCRESLKEKEEDPQGPIAKTDDPTSRELTSPLAEHNFIVTNERKGNGGDSNEEETTPPSESSASSKGRGSQSDGQQAEANEEAVEKSDKSDDEEIQLCGRCWKNPATCTLYSCPTCDDCIALAMSEKANKVGKQRFQPKNPELPPGKKLTKVCESCRLKRKRCPHRKVVNADDPRVAKRKRKSAHVADKADDASGSESGDSSSEEMEADPPAPKNDAPRTLQAGGRHKAAPLAEGPSDYNMRRAIQGAVKTVYQRELRRLVDVAEQQAGEASKAVEAVKAHISSWKDRYGEAVLEDEDGKGVEGLRAAVDSARFDLSVWLDDAQIKEGVMIRGNAAAILDGRPAAE
ncbi:hypothetical protein VTO42DRAFT_2054 [Malbranchea cinnamomea]